ncbi:MULTISPECIES: ABC transporter ATP-binding protein [Bifidobacterium]|jgi:putative ABC transport system ATP-binding protein|uniref:ABC transporter ATP-binding protein n=1 Tax=Bifidobacterium tibiigranuli TaxID=2172043 RepID=A0A5N6RX87_9BIFI|nr:ABC transporter ATP-binding protein [Bifidobacterium tibiigranuli]KAE8126416.1 ABC transporter ATP-binding protein [Bifidobacterium tibiigranuli]KAE8126517.1 ABC transporter ATP-binding protein [Bifidobacterium tibiigranuli]MCH3974318.1 ABC transporter ATP-binding protein [Bifidobacterium tibiigranuli]MCH4188881.1 ABC transporter ATP-binding protein [Bifidobacterium tibiigranuli]MCH4203214.1 ABC transporter ATP-binding protein [Bifidobacterium tibiigranuli]
MTTNDINSTHTNDNTDNTPKQGGIETPDNPKAHSEPVLELKDVSYAYTKGGKHVLDHISHRFAAGKAYAITGPSGAGKTTMLSLISGLANPTQGQVLYQGQDLAKLDRYRFRSHDIGVIFQSFNLLPALSAAENIMLSMDASGKRFDAPKRQRALELLAQVHLPEEYANERVLHLSGGEQQRVAIARAFSYDPQILVADEPTGNLDLATQADIMDIFRSLAHDQGRCVIIVTHSPDVASDCDEVFALAPLRRASQRGTAQRGSAQRKSVQRQPTQRRHDTVSAVPRTGQQS